MRLGTVAAIGGAILLALAVVSLGVVGVLLSEDKVETNADAADGWERRGAEPRPSVPEGAAPEVTKLGLFHTDADVDMWRERAIRGPYRAEGDAFDNSPGEWLRLREDAEAVREAPESFLWYLPEGSGCVPSAGHGMDIAEARNDSRTLAGAAMYALVRDDRELTEIIASVLVAQPEQQGVDFADRTRWCSPGNRDVGPVFALAHAMTSQLLAVDLVSDDVIGPADLEGIRGWHLGLAEVIDADIESLHGSAFLGRDDGDHRLSEDWRTPQRLHWWNDGDARMWWDSPQVDLLHNLYNNRWASMARYQGLVGLAFDHHHHRDRATLFFKEFIDFGVYPFGAHADLHRGFSLDPRPEGVAEGLQYMTLAAVHAFTYAEALARAGDPSLYEYRSTSGAHGTEGAPPREHAEAKSLKFLAHTLARYADGTFVRYVSEEPDEDFRLGWDVVNSGAWSRVAILSGYYRDPYIQRLYRGDGVGMPPWPADGKPYRWDAGDSGVFPAWMLWFADQEGRDYDPYP